MKQKKRKISLLINDLVKIIAGDYKGNIGKILSVNRYDGKVQIEGIAKKQRYVKLNQNDPKSTKKIEHVESFIDISNVVKIENKEVA